MNTPIHLERAFARLNMRVRSVPQLPRRWNRIPSAFDIDIASDQHGEYFLLRFSEQTAPELMTLDVRPELRQLLLLARVDERKDKFLCGFDERHLFTAAVPGTGVHDVLGAVQALKPPAVRQVEEAAGLRQKDRLRRRNNAFLRQGEWFFVPQPGLIVAPQQIHRNEPLSRGSGSKPHICAQAARFGGENVMVCPQHPSGVSLSQHKELLRSSREAAKWRWRQMVRRPELYVRGEVRHNDHATLTLPDWHRVLMNTENEAPGRRSVVFLD